jgi:hypothetical protein
MANVTQCITMEDKSKACHSIEPNSLDRTLDQHGEAEKALRTS